MLVRSRMTREVFTASPTTSLAEAIALARERRIRHLPITDGGRLVGVVSDRDLRLAVPPPGAVAEAERRRILDSTPVGEIMVREVVTVPPEAPVEEAARLMADHHIGCLPVMTADELVGIITETDLLRAFVELFHAGGPSSRIEVRMPNRPGELARVVRLIGIDHKVNITGMVVPQPVDPAVAHAIIHLQTLNPAPLVEALRKLGYQVGWPALD